MQNRKTHNGYKAVTFRGFEAYAIEALRELRAEKDRQIADIKQENEELREQLATFKSSVEELASQSKEQQK